MTPAEEWNSRTWSCWETIRRFRNRIKSRFAGETRIDCFIRFV